MHIKTVILIGNFLFVLINFVNLPAFFIQRFLTFLIFFIKTRFLTFFILGVNVFSIYGRLHQPWVLLLRYTCIHKTYIDTYTKLCIHVLTYTYKIIQTLACLIYMHVHAYVCAALHTYVNIYIDKWVHT